MKTREQAMRDAGQALATARHIAESMGPRELAEASWHHGCGMSVDELEAYIRRKRGLPLANAS